MWLFQFFRRDPTITAVSSRTVYKSYKSTRYTYGNLSTYPHVLQYLLRTYATYYIFSAAEPDLTHCTPYRLTEEPFADSLCNNSPRCGSVYN